MERIRMVVSRLGFLLRGRVSGRVQMGSRGRGGERLVGCLVSGAIFAHQRDRPESAWVGAYSIVTTIVPDTTHAPS